MKICGFTFIRDAVKFDFPVTESITSLLPIVDEFIVVVGNCNDGTLQLIESIGSPKIKVFHSVWDDTLKEGGRALAAETDKALSHIPPGYDWAFYLQADEVVHEKYLDVIVKAASQYANDKKVEGFVFKYVHFYGTYDYTGDSRRWYNHEIRLIRNNGNIISYRDAQGFRTRQNKKLAVKLINAVIYHYGWVRHPRTHLEKLGNFYGFWDGEEYIPRKLTDTDQFDYSKDVDSLTLFNGTHPAVMQKRIAERNWEANFDLRKKRFSARNRLLYRIEKLTGKRLFEYRNYRII